MTTDLGFNIIDGLCVIETHNFGVLSQQQYDHLLNYHITYDESTYRSLLDYAHKNDLVPNRTVISVGNGYTSSFPSGQIPSANFDGGDNTNDIRISTDTQINVDTSYVPSDTSTSIVVDGISYNNDPIDVTIYDADDNIIGNSSDYSPGDEVDLIFVSEGGVFEPVPQENAGFGGSCSIDGDVAIAGGPNVDGDFANSGVVTIYRKDPIDGWQNEQQLISPAGDYLNNHFGSDCAVSGDTIVVAAEAYNTAYVFLYVDGAWAFQASMSPGVGFDSDTSVAIDGDTLVISTASYTYIYTRTGVTWTYRITITGILTKDIALKGSDLILGTLGTAYIYVGSGDSWSLQQSITYPGSSNFGRSVDIDGDTCVISIPSYIVSTGCRTYTRSGETWTLEKNIIVSKNTFGEAAKVSIDGNYITISFPSFTFSVGVVRVYEKVAAPTYWDFLESYGGAAIGDLAGVGLALDGDSFIMGGVGAAYDFVNDSGIIRIVDIGSDIFISTTIGEITVLIDFGYIVIDATDFNLLGVNIIGADRRILRNHSQCPMIADNIDLLQHHIIEVT